MQNEDMSATIQLFEISLDRQGQYSGRNCFSINEHPENKNENTIQVVIQALKEKMGEEIKEVNFDWTHRLGASKGNKVWPITVKLARCKTRGRVFRNKNKLKRKEVNITESLAKMRMEALKRAREEFQFPNVQTSAGKIIYKDVNDNILRLVNNL